MLATRAFTRFVALVMFAVIGLAALTLLNSQPVRDLHLPRIAPTVAPGLSREHHGELNKVLGVPASRYDELRREYENNPVAQQQIDIYEPSTEYGKRLGEYVKALKAGDEEKIAELEEWFEEHYPDI